MTPEQMAKLTRRRMLLADRLYEIRRLEAQISTAFYVGDYEAAAHLIDRAEAELRDPLKE